MMLRGVIFISSFKYLCNFTLCLSFPSLFFLNFLIYIYNSLNDNKMIDCEICPLAKQKRLPFTPSSHVSSHYFDLIHCDLWGPFSTPTIDGCKFFLTIVDDCSRCTWVYLLKHKSQIQAILEQFYLMIEAQFS